MENEDLLVRKDGFGDLWDALEKKRRLLAQKSRLKWNQKGEVNSGYFHRIVQSRRCHNAIVGVHNSNAWIDEPEQVKNLFKDFYQSLFTENMPQRPTLDGLQFNSITNEQQLWLESSGGMRNFREGGRIFVYKL